MRLQESKTYLKDLDTAIEHSIGIEKLRNTCILITGASGTIGSFITDMLLRYNQINVAGIKICVAGRNINKLKNLFSFWNDHGLFIYQYDMNSSIQFNKEIDYVIHAAGNAHPTAFNSDPVGTIVGNINGTYNLLEYSRIHKARRFLYVSSGEVYGQGDISLDEFDEKYAGYVDISSTRSCYPSSKRTAENLCVSYKNQYKLDTVIVRPCHTYGPGITDTDSRANVQFIHNALNGEDIVMKSLGTQLRSYNYIADCAAAILTVLINGKMGEAYNIANPHVRVTIAQFAEIVAKLANCKVVFENPTNLDVTNRTPIAKQVLCSQKIEKLGWTGFFNIEMGIKHTIEILKGK